MPSMKIVLLGDSSVGKSSLVQRFASDTFDANLPNTIGAAFISKPHTSSARTVKLEIWDTAGQERYKSLTPMYYRNAHVALVCFDLSAPEPSFLVAKYWIDQLAVLGPLNIRVCVVGNKSDLAAGGDAFVHISRIRDLCVEQNYSYFETSAKTGLGVGAIFDAVVDGLDDEFFQQAEPLADVLGEDSFLRLHRARSSCC